MNPQLTLLLAKQHIAELHRTADRLRIASGSMGREHESHPRNRIAELGAGSKRLTSRPAATLRPPGRPAAGGDRAVTIRPATSVDLAPIREIAALDSQRPPSGPLLIAEVGDEVVAAIAVGTHTVIANPFKPTADAVALLRLRAEQLNSMETPTSLGRLGARNAAAEA